MIVWIIDGMCAIVNTMIDLINGLLGVELQYVDLDIKRINDNKDYYVRYRKSKWQKNDWEVEVVCGSKQVRKTIKKLLKQDSWDDIYNLICNLQFEKWPISRKIQSELKDKSKQIRDKVEKPIKDFRDTIFIYQSKEAVEDIYDMYKILNILEKVILKFSNKYQENKKEKNIIDFSDIEHFALKILVKKDENDNYIPTEVAKIYKEKF